MTWMKTHTQHVFFFARREKETHTKHLEWSKFVGQGKKERKIGVFGSWFQGRGYRLVVFSYYYHHPPPPHQQDSIFLETGGHFFLFPRAWINPARVDITDSAIYHH